MFKTHQLPEQLVKSLGKVEGFNEQAFKAVHTSGAQVTSIRINPLKASIDELALPASEQVKWCRTGYYLNERPSFTFDPSLHGGAYYVQEASSMFVDFILKQLYTNGKPQHVLDLCAAPGGKSTLLASALPDSFIVSNEVIKTRVTILAENMSKWGSSNVVVTHNDPKDFKRLPAFFDLIVIDAPCSGSGLFRKDADAIDEWSEANVELCSMRQQRILADTITALNENGYLIYSTCSYSNEEDEDICDWIVDELHLAPVKIDIDASWGIVETISDTHSAPGYRFYPDKLKGEGFFIACFQQRNAVDQYYHQQQSSASISKQEKSIIQSWIRDVDEYVFTKQQDLIIASPLKWQAALLNISKSLSLRKSGVAVGSIKGKDLIPHHELALSNILSDSVAFVDLNKEDALKYLRRQDIAVPPNSVGWTLARYQNINLGWMKVLPNRVNNYYPVNWRILKS